jgi:hypothetical protein
MPTLSPFGLLVIFLALSVAPPSATHVRIEMPPSTPTTLTRAPSEWWVRDETPPSVSFKREGTGLVLGSLPDQAETRTDLAAQFELTGREDLTRNATIRARPSAGGGQVTTEVEPSRMTVRVTAGVATQEAIITWSPR